MLDLVKTDGKYDTRKLLAYALIFCLGGITGVTTREDPEIRHPAAFKALGEVPARLIEVERDPSGYRIFLDQATGRQIFYFGGTMVVLPEQQTPALEDLTNPFGSQ